MTSTSVTHGPLEPPRLKSHPVLKTFSHQTADRFRNDLSLRDSLGNDAAEVELELFAAKMAESLLSLPLLVIGAYVLMQISFMSFMKEEADCAAFSRSVLTAQPSKFPRTVLERKGEGQEDRQAW